MDKDTFDKLPRVVAAAQQVYSLVIADGNKPMFVTSWQPIEIDMGDKPFRYDATTKTTYRPVTIQGGEVKFATVAVDHAQLLPNGVAVFYGVADA